MLPNPFCPFACPFSAAQILALRATVLLLLTLLIKARIRIVAFSALGFALLLLYARIRRLERKLTEFVRASALQDGRGPEERP